jgi:hypothetical protein
MSLNLSGEVTAIATMVLAVFAVVTAAFAIFAFYKQSHEVDILIEQNDRDIRDRRRDQASRVFIWAEAGSSPQDQIVTALTTHIKNTSARPVYDGLLAYRNSYGHMEASLHGSVFRVLMPDDQVETSNAFRQPVPVAEFLRDNSRFQARLRFRDAAGVFWELDSDGQLKEMSSLEGGIPSSGRRARRNTEAAASPGHGWAPGVRGRRGPGG